MLSHQNCVMHFCPLHPSHPTWFEHSNTVRTSHPWPCTSHSTRTQTDLRFLPYDTYSSPYFCAPMPYNCVPLTHHVTMAYLGVLVPQYIDHPWFGKFSGPPPIWSQWNRIWGVSPVTSGEEYKLWSSSLCTFLQSPVTPSILGPHIPLSTLFSNTLTLNTYIFQSLRFSTTGLRLS
jgi:hypothetical protein